MHVLTLGFSFSYSYVGRDLSFPLKTVDDDDGYTNIAISSRACRCLTLPADDILLADITPNFLLLAQRHWILKLKLALLLAFLLQLLGLA